MSRLHVEDLENLNWLLENAYETVKPLRSVLDGGTAEDREQLAQCLTAIAKKRTTG
jgi:hypothetical protein